MKYYLDEDISPKIAKLLRKQKIDCTSAHERDMVQASDLEQLAKSGDLTKAGESLENLKNELNCCLSYLPNVIA